MKTYTIKFTDEELQAMAAVLNAGVQALGLRAVMLAATFLPKIENPTPDEEPASEQEKDNG